MPETHENTYKELLIYLQNVDVSFVIVEVNEPAKQETIVADLIADLPGKNIKKVDLQDADVSTGYLPEIRKHIEINPSVEILLILNIHKVKMESADDATALVNNMNLSRELYLRLNKVLVFFIPTYFVDLIIKTAKDFFSYVSITFKFLDVDKYPFMELSSQGEYFNEQEVKNRVSFLENTLNTYTLTKEERAKTFFDLAESYRKLFKHDRALENYLKSLKIRQETGDKKGEGVTLNNISQIYDARGDYDSALKYLLESLKINKVIGYKQGESVTLNNIGQIYQARGDYDSALKYLLESLTIRREIGYKQGEGVTLNNISLIYHAKGDYDGALKYLLESLKIRRETGDKQGEGVTLNNIGLIYKDRGDYDSALKYLLESLIIRREIGDTLGVANALFNLAMLYATTGKQDEASKCMLEVVEINKTLKSYEITQALKSVGIEG